MRANSGGGAGNLGRLGRTLDVYQSIESGIATNFTSGGLPPIATQGTVPGVGHVAGMFPVGANGPDGIAASSGVGTAHIFFSPGAIIRDQYCAWTPRVNLLRPSKTLPDPFAVWEVEADVIMRLPAGTIANDLGMVLHIDTATTGYGTDFTNLGAGISGGIALMATGNDNQIRCLARRTGGGFSVNKATGIIAQAPGAAADTFRRLMIRLESATPARDARCTWFVDGVQQHQLALTAAAGMPDVTLIPPAGAVNWLAAFRPFLRNGGNNVSGAVFAYKRWRVSAAPSVAAMASI